MINTKKVIPKLSYVMSTFFYVDGLLEAQLKNLNKQTCKDFEVVIVDPHYKKRNIVDLCNQLDFNVVHIPYLPNFKIPKYFDYCILNNGVLLSNTNKIVLFQDWRFIHPYLTKILLEYNCDFIDLSWQMPAPFFYDIHDFQIKPMQKTENILDMSEEQFTKMLKDGDYPLLNIETSSKTNFSSWGHYCISKDLWLNVGGIDELATNTKHYADLDLNRRLNNYYNNRNLKIEIPLLKNVMMRIGHSKGSNIGGSNVPLDYTYVVKPCSICSSKSLPGISHIDYHNHVVDNITNSNYKSLFNHDDKIIGYMCNHCNLIGEIPHWYEYHPNIREKSVIGGGIDGLKLGRNLETIYNDIVNLPLYDKVIILNNSWYENKYLV